MQVHARARLTPKGRAFVVSPLFLEGGWSVTAAAEAAGVTERTVLALDLPATGAEGEAGLLRSLLRHPASIPHANARRSSPGWCSALRRASG